MPVICDAVSKLLSKLRVHVPHRNVRDPLLIPVIIKVQTSLSRSRLIQPVGRQLVQQLVCPVVKSTYTAMSTGVTNCRPSVDQVFG